VLDLTKAEVRKAIMESENAKTLYQGALAGDYSSI